MKTGAATGKKKKADGGGSLALEATARKGEIHGIQWFCLSNQIIRRSGIESVSSLYVFASACNCC